MGRAEDEAAERERAARRAAIRAEISDCRNKINRLNSYKSQLRTEYDESSNSVHTPGNNYDLTVSTDIAHWVGKLQSDGDTKRNILGLGVNTLMSGIENVIGTIDSVIARLYDKIASLERELASI